jgi:arginase
VKNAAVKKRAIAIIGAPLDLGAGRRGVDMGPSAVRVAGLGSRLTALGHDVSDLGNVPVAQAESVGDAGPNEAKYLPQIAATCERLGELAGQALADGKTPLVLGGDHSIAIGTAAVVSRFFRESNRAIGMLWLDAHADMNTPESSPTGNVHGMPLACCVGMGPRELARMFGFSPKVNPANVALVGIRNVDRLEAQTVRATGVRVFTMREIDERGMPAVIEEAIGIATQGATQGTAGFHLSFDMDFVDPQYAPGVGTPVRGGATYREAHLAMEVICDSGKVVSMEVVEVNPVIDEVNRTADLAVELILSAMGKKIL